MILTTRKWHESVIIRWFISCRNNFPLDSYSCQHLYSKLWNPKCWFRFSKIQNHQFQQHGIQLQAASSACNKTVRLSTVLNKNETSDFQTATFSNLLLLLRGGFLIALTTACTSPRIIFHLGISSWNCFWNYAFDWLNLSSRDSS